MRYTCINGGIFVNLYTLLRHINEDENHTIVS